MVFDMKNLKKLLAFAIVLVMMLAMCAPVMAADDTTTTINIEIKRDGSYGSSATGNREYTWYKVFSAVPADGQPLVRAVPNCRSDHL